MATRLRLEDAGHHGGLRTPVPGTEVKIAIDLSRTSWVMRIVLNLTSLIVGR